MLLKKSLISRQGQAALEYFILFAVIVSITLVSLSTFYPQFKDAVFGDGVSDGYVVSALKGIMNADGNKASAYF
jgi:uncharacterized protein (UPF0333 family)